MKKVISAVLCIALLLALCPAALAETYTASAYGNNGNITVEVSVADGKIESVTVVEHSETPGISDPAFEKIPAAIVENQSLAVDVVSGCSNSSKAILAAVEDCAAQAGLDVEALKAAKEEDVAHETETLNCDIVVVGAGGTGLAAAAAAKDKGASVIVIEKLATVGGSTKVAGGALAAAGTIYQKAAGIVDTKEEWFNYWIEDQKAGSLVECEYPDEARLDALMDEAVTTVEWIGETIGMEYATPRQFGWGGPNRAHVAAASPIPPSGRGSSGGGVFIIEALMNYIENDVPVMTETAGEKLITNENGDVIGIHAVGADKDYDIYADSVILACGGFAHNAEMLAEYIPGATYSAYADISRSCVGNTGDGMRMAMEVGGVMYDDPWIIGLSCISRITAANSALNTINNFKDTCFVNQDGRRFINEDVAYMTSSVAAVDTAWEIIDSSNPDRAATLEENMDGVEIVKGETFEELAAAMGCDPAVLVETMTKYNEAARTGDDTEFHKVSDYIVALEQGPFYAVQVCPVTGGTLGGVKTNEKFQVIREDGSVIKGLYAGGESANKIYYNQVYTSGSGLTIAITSGRIAGESAASELVK